MDKSPRNALLAKALSSFVIAGTVTLLLVWPIYMWNALRGVGVLMVLFPILFGMAWALGGWLPLLQALGEIVLVLVLVTLKNAIPIPTGSKLNPEDDRSLALELQTRERILETESEDRFNKLAAILRKYQRFKTNRRRIFIFAGIVAVIGTALLHRDMSRLKRTGQSFVIPHAWQQTHSDNIYSAFPAIFILIAVPLCVLFASYSRGYLMVTAALTLYFGTAFFFIFRSADQSLPVYAPYIVIGLLVSGVGLGIDWVSADSSHLADEEDS